MVEEWRDISDFEGKYQVSNLGRVKSLKRQVNIKGGVRTVSERILKPQKDNLGYCHVRLSSNNIARICLVHRLVAKEFISNPNNYPCINHIDGNPSNNNLTNLEWCTYEYNSNYYLCKEKQSRRMLQRYSDDPEFLEACQNRLAIWHNKRSKPVCQLTKDNTLVKIWKAASATSLDGFIANDVIQCANGKRKTHKGYVWVWQEDYMKGRG